MWKNVLWAGETKIALFGLDTKHCIWEIPKTAHEPENTISTARNGAGRIMLQGCWDWDISTLVRVKGKTGAGVHLPA